MKKLLISLSAMILLLAGSANLASAAEFIAPENQSGSVVISNTNPHHNVYTAGQSITVDTDIQGDLVAAGGKILVNSGVEDMALAGGDINIIGGARGDIRAMGGTVIINGLVSGDVIIAGGTVHLTEKSTVDGDVIIAGGEVTLDGSVQGQIKIVGSKVRLNGVFSGDIKIRSEELSVGSKANSLSKIFYKGVNEARVEEGAVLSGLEFEKIENQNNWGKHFAGILTLGFVLKLLAGIVAGILLIKLFPRTSNLTVERIKTHPWSNLGIGFLAMVIIPVCALILLVTFIGYYVAAIAFFGYIFLVLLACVASTVFIGALIIKLLTKKPNLVVDWQAVAIGVVVVAILGFIPVIGWLVTAIVMLMAFGALIRIFKGHIDSEQSNVQVPQELPQNIN